MLKVKKLSFIREVQILLVKAERKLEHAQRAYNVGDYDSALGDSYRCVELCIRALLLSHGIIKIPKNSWWNIAVIFKRVSVKRRFSTRTSQGDRFTCITKSKSRLFAPLR